MPGEFVARQGLISRGNVVVTGSLTTSGSLTATGTITATTLVVQTVTSSISSITGSTNFGSLSSNTHVFTGSMNVTGAFYVASGSAGIGTTSPAELLEISSPAIAGTSQQTRLRITQAGSISARANLVSGVISGENPYFAIETRQSASPFSIVERLRIDGSGNVGIGTSSPNIASFSGTCLTLEAGGSTSTKSAGIELAWAGATRSLWGGYSGGVYIGTWSNENFEIRTNATERMRITSGGRIAMGTSTTGYGLFTEQRLTINPTSDGVVVGPLPQNNSAYTTQAGDNSGTRYALYIANASSSSVGNISFTSSSTSYNTSSDYRLKQDLKNFDGLSILSKVKTYDFEWKIDNSRMYGVIAHELAEVLPYAVNGEKDEVDDNGNIVTQGVDYSKIVPVLVKAIQELEARVKELENK